ncbi:MAG: hypothetical protein FWC00_00335 [Firmicutes bacterium]|nr:hypothetical protein [Bacillota bacterium]
MTEHTETQRMKDGNYLIIKWNVSPMGSWEVRAAEVKDKEVVWARNALAAGESTKKKDLSIARGKMYEELH